jgi:heat-inducible transcriptional repressor
VDARKARVLAAVVDHYLASAEPVGSRTLARRDGFGLSAATLRNELADLEEWGYLDKPHTSAGRVPSDKGYRYYVDRLLVRPSLSADEADRIRSAYRAHVREASWFLQQTARLLSAVSGYPAVVMMPPMSAVHVRNLMLVPLGDRGTALVMETDGGLVAHRMLSVPPDVTPADLAHMTAVLSRELAGIPLTEVAHLHLSRLERELGTHAAFAEEVLALLPGGSASAEPVATVEGFETLFGLPEFHEVSRIRAVWELLSQNTVVGRLLAGMGDEPLAVRIGEELAGVQISDLSVVGAALSTGGQVLAHVAVVGPRRMNYGHVLAVVEQIATEWNRALG